MLYVIKRMVQRYFDERIPQSAAELAYFLLFSIFPLLVFVNYVLSRLNLPVESILSALELLPRSVQTIIGTYFEHLSQMDGSISPLLTGIALTLISLSRAVRSVMYTVGDIYHIEVRRTGVRSIVTSVFFSAGILVSIVASFLLVVGGKMIWGFVGEWFDIHQWVVSLSKYLGFLFAFLFIFVFLLLLNKYLPNTELRWREVWPGAVFSLLTWIVVSLAFSFYVDNLATYSRIYGSLAAIIVLMLWLYMISIILLMGPQLNHTILSMRLYKMEYQGKKHKDVPPKTR